MKCGIMSAMKDWKTYALIALAAWCAYLTWRTMPYQIWEANEAQMGSRDDVYWIGNRHPPAKPPKLNAQTNVVKRLPMPGLIGERRKQ